MEFRNRHIDWKVQYQQAIDSAPFIRNEDAVYDILFKPFKGKLSKDQMSIKPNHPYQVDLSGYDVSEPFDDCPSIPNCTCRMLSCEHVRTYVTLTPKAVENKQVQKAESLPINAERKKIELCAEWLKYCLEIGYDKSQLDGLQKLWMDNHDYTGKFVPKVEKAEATESQAELFSLVYRIMDQGGLPEERFILTHKGEAKQ